MPTGRSRPSDERSRPTLSATALRDLPPLPADRGLPGAADLLAGAGTGSVARFLDGRGLEPDRIDAAQAHYRPGRSLAICYRAVAHDRSTGAPACLTVTVERRRDEPDAVWAFPDDPQLPGLAAAADGRLVRRRIRPRPEWVAAEPLRYRPRRRAVLRYRLPDGTVLFGKVVSPGRARRLLALADLLAGAGPADAAALLPGRVSPAAVGRPTPADPAASLALPLDRVQPGVLGRPAPTDRALSLALPIARVAPGALVLPALAGTSLRDLFLAGGPLPSPEQTAALPERLDRLCSPGLPPAPRESLPRRRVDPATAATAARFVADLLPGEGDTANRVAEAVAGWVEASEPPEEWTVHGDLYENQVMVDGDRFGLLDLDDLGPGDPLLDVANFSAHLLLLGTSGPATGPTILAWRDELRAAFCRRLDADPAQLAWREAYCLLRLVSGPFRVLRPDWPRRMAARLALAAAALPAR